MSETLPCGWAWATPDEITAKVPNGLTIGPFGSDLKVPDYRDAGVPLVFVREIRAGRFGDERTKYVDVAKAEKLSRHYARPGDLLVTKMGDPPGDTAVYPDGRPPAIITADCIKLTPNAALTEAAFLRDCLRAEPVRSQILEQTAGVAQQKLSLERFRTVRLPIPPLNEQRRIVAKLEALQTRSRRAREALDAVPPLLEKLRQSILAAAFRGDLTKEWRAKNKDEEPASKLLERIRAERRKKWEETELAKMKARGKGPADDKWNAKYKEPVGVDAAELPTLPVGWCWATIEFVGDVLLGRRRAAEEYIAGQDGRVPRPYVRVANVKQDRLVLDDVLHMPFNDGELALYRLQPGDIILSEGQSAELVGQSAIYRGGLNDLCIQATVHRFRAYDFATTSEFAQLVFLNHLHSGVFQRASALTTNIAHLTSERLRPLRFPLPPMEEQRLVVERTRRALAYADSLVARCRDIRGHHKHLEAAVLARAFRGELLPQDPRDEPAEAMLARLRRPPGQANGKPVRTPRKPPSGTTATQE